MSGIQDIIQNELTPDKISQISGAIGADPATTQQAIAAAVPMMMGGMASHAATPAGAEALDAAAEQHSGMLDSLSGMLGGAGAGGLGTILGDLTGMMGGATPGSAPSSSDGGVLGGLGGMLGSAAAGGILGKVLGANHSNVQNGVTQASGLDPQKAGRLLMILAPIVLAAIAHHKQQTGASTAQVSNDLQREAQAQVHAQPHLGGILGSILNKATGQS
jgi:hypothetical protein